MVWLTPALLPVPMDPRKVAVTLVCAADDEAALEPVLERLNAGGYEAELVAGVDLNPRRVGEALDRCGEWGVIVACVSKRLDGPELRKVEGVFGARHGPNHAILRIDISQPELEIIAAVQRAIETVATNADRVARQPPNDTPKLRDVVAANEVSSLALPVVRLDPNEELDGDTTRIQLPDNPKSAELSRRRRAARARERERERITSKHRRPVQPSAPNVDEDAAKLDRMMIVMIIGAGILAVLAALSFSGAL